MAEEITSINDIQGIDQTDRICYMGSGGVLVTFYRNLDNTEWGTNVMEKVGPRLKAVWHNDRTIPPNTPFWYMRKGATPLLLKLPAE